jgi:hypothetical protein
MLPELLTSIIKNFHYYLIILIGLIIWISRYISTPIEKEAFSFEDKNNKFLFGFIIISTLLFLILLNIYSIFYELNVWYITLTIIIALISIFLSIIIKKKNEKISSLFFGTGAFLIVLLIGPLIIKILDIVKFGYSFYFIIFFFINIFLISFFVLLKSILNEPKNFEIKYKKNKLINGQIIESNEDKLLIKNDNKLIYISKNDIKNIKKI